MDPAGTGSGSHVAALKHKVKAWRPDWKALSESQSVDAELTVAADVISLESTMEGKQESESDHSEKSRKRTTQKIV